MRPSLRFASIALTLALGAGCASSTDLPLEPLAAPENVDLAWEDVRGDFSELRLNVTWDPVDGAVGYRLRIYLADSYSISNDLGLAPDSNEIDVDVTDPSAALELFHPGDRFAYRVGALREDGEYFSGPGVSITTAPIVPDLALARCIESARAALALVRSTEGVTDEPTYADVRRIQCDGEGVADLSRVGVLSSLRTLVLSDNAIVDLAPLSELTSLEVLTLAGNPGITTLEPLAGLDALESLTLADHPALSDLAGVPTTLRTLTMEGDVPVAGLERLTELGSLSIEGTALDDIAFVEGMEHLLSIGLGDNGLIDITPLLSLERLHLVSLSGNDGIPCAQLDALAAHLEPGATLARPDTCAE